MADLDAGHDHVKRRQRLLQFQPAQPAPPGRVLTGRVFDHQALIVPGPRRIENPVELLRGVRLDEIGQHEWRRKVELVEQPPPFAEWLLQQIATVQVQHVEGDEDDRHVGQELSADHLAPQSVLQLKEGAHDAALECQQLAVEQDIVRHDTGRGHHLGKGGRHLVEIA